MSFIRSLLNIVIIILSTTILGSIAIVLTGIFRMKKAFVWLTYRWVDILIKWCGIEIKKNILCPNEEFVPPVLFMSNHQSHYDIPVIYSTLPIFTMFLAKKELRKIPFLGWAMWTMGFVFIDRKNREEAFKSIEEAARQFVEEKRSIVVFPEGTRSTDGNIGPFKKGGFHLAIQAKAKIIPMGIWGTIKILPKGSWFVRPGRAVITVGRPIDASHYSRENLDELINEVRKAIEELTLVSRKEWESINQNADKSN